MFFFCGLRKKRWCTIPLSSMLISVSRNICPLFTDHNTCAVKNVVYQVTCNICQQAYVGETLRQCHYRFAEHLRAVRNPATYPENAIGQHYNVKHKTMNADLSFKIIDRQSITAKRKISEAFHIIKQDTKLNNRDEMVSLRNTLSRMFWTCLNFLCILCNIDLVFTFMCV